MRLSSTIDLDVITHRVGGPETDHRIGRQPFLGNQTPQHFLRVGEQLLGLHADDIVVENAGITT